MEIVMIEILKDCIVLLLGLGIALWDVVVLVMTWVGSMVYHLHLEAPRLEGLLVGVLLAWLMVRRDKHPVLRVLSSPLKLMLDILDLAWDQAVECVSDVISFVLSWLNRTLAFVKGKITSAWHWMMSSLKGVRDKLMGLSKKE
jgi:hypothetical protein